MSWTTFLTGLISILVLWYILNIGYDILRSSSTKEEDNGDVFVPAQPEESAKNAGDIINEKEEENPTSKKEARNLKEENNLSPDFAEEENVNIEVHDGGLSLSELKNLTGKEVRNLYNNTII